MGEEVEGLNRARLLVGWFVFDWRWSTSIGALTNGVPDMEALSLLNVERDTSRERTRLRRANLRDFRRSFSTAEHNEVKEIPDFKKKDV